MEKIRMTKKGQKRVKLMELVIAGTITLKEAGDRMGVTERQAQRIKRSYIEKGDESLNHGLIGKGGNHRIELTMKNTVISIYQERYNDFGPKLASEMLEEEFSIKINAETLRRWLKREGLWISRKKSKHMRRRKRKAQFGMMLQMDGSIHDWLENGTKICLQNCIDDATGKSFGLFDTGETSEIALKVLYYWIKKYGIPQTLYTDYKTVYYTDREPTIEEQKAGIIPLTAFGKVCYKLGIHIIYASSPQAKGRVERSNGVLQDRLIKIMRLKEITNIESANEFLINEFWDSHNAKFERISDSSKDAHVPLLPNQNLDEIINFEDERIITNDFVVRWNNRYFQLLKKQDVALYPRLKVIMQLWLDHSIHIRYKGTELFYKELFEKDNIKVYNTA